MPEVDSNAQSTVTLVLDRLHFAQSCRHAEPLVDAGIGRGLRRALAGSFVQHKFDYVL